MRGHVLLALVLVGAAAAMISGAGFLLWQLPGGVPLGNAITVIGLIASAWLGLSLTRPATWIRWATVVVLSNAVAWYPIGIVVSANSLCQTTLSPS